MISVICCDISSPLTVALGASKPFIGIGTGSYSNHTTAFPLLAVTNDNGLTWNYPTNIFKDLKTTIDPLFITGELTGASCTGSSNKSVCITPGNWCKGSEFCESFLPLVAVGNNNGTSWTYPKSVYENLTTRVHADLKVARLDGSSCFGSGGSSVCIAAGLFNTSNTTLPLLAQSSNGGQDWNYPHSIFENLPSKIEPDFTGGHFTTASCTKSTCDSVCIAAGGYCKGEDCSFPLIAVSRDKGNSWVYPHDVFTDLKTKIGSNFVTGLFDKSSCTGTGNKAVCIATGSFFTGPPGLLPWIALTQDGGTSWTYPTYIFKDLNITIDPGFQRGSFYSASCTGKDTKAVCVAAGAFDARRSKPFLVVTRDGGNSWHYPDFIYTKLKTVVDPNFVQGAFIGSSCTGSGSKSICTAVGYYCNDRFCNNIFPLLALSTNGGKNWSYPPSIYSNLTSSIDPDYKRALLSDVSCSGVAHHSFCVASGQLETTTGLFPLTAISTDDGATWTYPKYIFQNLTTKLDDEDYLVGSFQHAGSTGGELKKIDLAYIKHLINKLHP